MVILHDLYIQRVFCTISTKIAICIPTTERHFCESLIAFKTESRHRGWKPFQIVIYSGKYALIRIVNKIKRYSDFLPSENFFHFDVPSSIALSRPIVTLKDHPQAREQMFPNLLLIYCMYTVHPHTMHHTL